MFSSRMKLVDEVNCKVMKVFMHGWECPGSSCTSCSSSSSSTRERPIFLPQLDNKSTATLKLILKKILQRTRVQLNKPIENNIFNSLFFCWVFLDPTFQYQVHEHLSLYFKVRSFHNFKNPLCIWSKCQGAWSRCRIHDVEEFLIQIQMILVSNIQQNVIFRCATPGHASSKSYLTPE